MDEVENIEIDGKVEQEVVDPVQEVSKELEGGAETNADVETKAKVKAESPKRDFEKDNAYATMRKNMEEARNAKNQLENDNKRLMNVLKKYNLVGDTVDDFEDNAEAFASGRDVDVVRAERIKLQQEREQQEQMQSELSMYREQVIEARMKQDLQDIQAINPEIKSLDELGEKYLELIQKGINGVDAYMLLDIKGLYAEKNVKAEQDALKKIQENSAVSVGSAQGSHEQSKSFNDMSAEEFEVYVQKAKNGYFQ